MDHLARCVLYLCPSLLVQLYRHQRRRPFLADGGVSTLPEKVAAFLLPRPAAPHLRVLPATNWGTHHDHNDSKNSINYSALLKKKKKDE